VRHVDESGGRYVVTAYDYPLLGLFWTMLFLFFWIAVLFLLFRVFADIFRSRDLSGWAKALWVIFVILVPFIGVVAYLIVRAHAMSEREIEETQHQSQAFRSSVQEVARSATGGAVDELSKLADLKERGVVTDAEFEQQKAKLLS
jgi:type VI protein secretion system component VasK